MDFSLTEEQLKQEEEEEEEKDDNQLDLSLYTETELYNRESLQAQDYDLTFIASGPVVKVYQADENDTQFGLKHHMNLPLLKDADGQVIRPTNLVLHNGEQQLIFNDANNMKNISIFDLNKGQIVETFQADKNANLAEIKHMTNAFRNGQRDNERTFVGINDRAIYTLDPRLNKNFKVALSKVYKTNPAFSNVATTLEGGLAIGSLSGEIRLYKEVGSNAKTLLPGLGDPIRSVDMSYDGKWVLATTQTYLLLISTVCENGKTGFEQRMGKEKPLPKKLQIHVKDLAKYRINHLDFTPARFNNFKESTMEHSSIVTSSGPYLITWNFKKVVKGHLKSYQIKKIDKFHEVNGSIKKINNWGTGAHNVVDSQFKFNDDSKILVTEPKCLGVQTRSMTKKKV